MKKNTIVWIVVVVIILIIIAVIISKNNSAPASAINSPVTTIPTAAPMIPAPTGAVVLNTGTSASLGTYLVATNGMTLYRDAKDTSGVSNCTGACATAWPPYTVSASTPLVGGNGVTGIIATFTRADGTMQVTYNGMPLYFFQSDSNMGDTTGQNVNGFTVVQP